MPKNFNSFSTTNTVFRSNPPPLQVEVKIGSDKCQDPSSEVIPESVYRRFIKFL